MQQKAGAQKELEATGGLTTRGSYDVGGLCWGPLVSSCCFASALAHSLCRHLHVTNREPIVSAEPSCP